MYRNRRKRGCRWDAEVWGKVGSLVLKWMSKGLQCYFLFRRGKCLPRDRSKRGRVSGNERFGSVLVEFGLGKPTEASLGQPLW